MTYGLYWRICAANHPRFVRGWPDVVVNPVASRCLQWTQDFFPVIEEFCSDQSSPESFGRSSTSPSPHWTSCPCAAECSSRRRPFTDVCYQETRGWWDAKLFEQATPTRVHTPSLESPGSCFGRRKTFRGQLRAVCFTQTAGNCGAIPIGRIPRSSLIHISNSLSLYIYSIWHVHSPKQPKQES